MKLLTFAIPCYNSQEYMGKCIESLLPGGDEVEILIIDDGSTDLTADIADKYEEKYPGIVRAIHQENGGHGEAVNTGIRNASGLYFKVVDSDDWVDKDAYRQVLDKLRELTGGDTVLDMMLCNFVYDKDGAKRKKVMHYESSVPVEELVSWEDTKHFRKGRYILMHSVIYRTRLLRKCGIELPKHTFYVDNIYVFEPLPYVKTIYYLPVNFYRYYIGREDQSVNESVMISRIDQQITVTKLMIDYFRDTKVEDGKLRRYMRNYLEIMMVISSIFLIKAGDPESLSKKKQLWEYLRSKDTLTYFVIRHSMLGQSMNLHGKGGRKIAIGGYKIAQMLVGFN
ncbi:MAG: glycosyltransferase family 2 protein [Lachnospiraceae bacterium]|nr:glycosyltransferase family 2 protein [Lachnospiraceae bacterium]MBQ2453045.1 glycosyltransferase family 2 protein [Lachnospiraceae bacterium]MBQ4241554.1 glycosyltransferase family 2 protein [Lachnospiraceae bacterium]MBQ5534718.1 glycosyltransferase family 2 protein [Lachnospiraceae bacterium]